MTETLSVRIGNCKELFKKPDEAFCKIKHGNELKTTRMAKKKGNQWSWNELIQLKLDPADKNATVEVWFPKLLKKQMIGYITVDISNPKLPKTPVWYKVGKPKDNPPKSRGEIEITFEVSGKKKGCNTKLECVEPTWWDGFFYACRFSSYCSP
jgi:hypothetical protein